MSNLVLKNTSVVITFVLATTHVGSTESDYGYTVSSAGKTLIKEDSVEAVFTAFVAPTSSTKGSMKLTYTTPNLDGSVKIILLKATGVTDEFTKVHSLTLKVVTPSSSVECDVL